MCNNKNVPDMQSFSGAVREAGRGRLSARGEEGAKTKYRLVTPQGLFGPKSSPPLELTNLCVAVLSSVER